MDALIEILTQYGYWGMLASAFLAGSILPFSSEAVIIALVAAGLHPPTLIAYATIGNVAGGLLNYAIGRQGRLDWIEKYLHVKKEKLDKVQRIMSGYGAWAGFLAFVPVLGSAITVALGLTRANLTISTVSMTLGKLLRYWLIVYGANLFF